MSLNLDPQQNRLNQDGKEGNLSRYITGIQAADHMDDEATLFTLPAERTSRPYYRDHRDIEFENTPRFGQKGVFKLKNEGYGLVSGLEFVMKLPRLGDNSQPVATAHPDDVGYGGGGNFLRWQRYIGEFMLGGLDGKIAWRHGTEYVRTTTPEELHTKRLLCTDDIGTAKRNVYDNAVLRIEQDADEEVWLYIPLWVPWGIDGISLNHQWPSHATGVPLSCEINFPRLLQCIQTDVAASNVRVITDGAFDNQGTFTAFIRAHYNVVSVVERNEWANKTFEIGGLANRVLHSVSEQKVTTTQTGAHTVKIDLEASLNPIVFMVASVRMADDNKEVGVAHEAADVRADPRSVGGVIARPDWLRKLPIDAWYLLDNGQRISPVFSSGYYNNSTFGHCSMFPSSAPGPEHAVVSFSWAPYLEEHGLGHQMPTASTKLQLALELPALPTAEAALTTREVVLHTYERNRVALERGHFRVDYGGTAQ